MAVVQEFVYRAVDPRGGSVVKGTIEAPTESAVTGKLKAQGLTPLEVTLKSKTGLNREIKLPGGTKHVSAQIARGLRAADGGADQRRPAAHADAVDPHRADRRQEAAARARAGAGRRRERVVVLGGAGAASADLPAADAQHRQGRRDRRLPRRRAVIDRRELPARGRAAEQDPRGGHLPDHRADHRDHRRARDGDVRRAGLREHVRGPRAPRCRCRPRSSSRSRRTCGGCCR